MKIKLLAVGKTDKSALQQLTDAYCKRLNHYTNFTVEMLPDIKNSKNLSEAEQKKKEGKQLLNKLKAGDHIVLLDEKGMELTSMQFSAQLQKWMNSGIKNLVFVIGGPYGFDEEVYKRAQQKLALSKMTFSHQMIRLFFTEQLYRGFSILKNEPYHHQ